MGIITAQNSEQEQHKVSQPTWRTPSVIYINCGSANDFRGKPKTFFQAGERRSWAPRPTSPSDHQQDLRAVDDVLLTGGDNRFYSFSGCSQRAAESETWLSRID
jgi:hypothetical protein